MPATAPLTLDELRDAFQRYTGGTDALVDHALAAIVVRWGMQEDQLPAVVSTLAAESGMGPSAVLAWLHLTGPIIDCPHGRMLCRLLGDVAGRIDAANADPPPRERAH